MLLFRKYHFNKDSGVITYICMFCIFQCNAGQLLEMQFHVVQLETMINTHDIGTLGGGGRHKAPNSFPYQGQAIAYWMCTLRKAFVFQVVLPEIEAKLSLSLLCYFITNTGVKWQCDNFGPQDIRRIKLFRMERSRQQASTFFIHCRSFCSWSVFHALRSVHIRHVCVLCTLSGTEISTCYKKYPVLLDNNTY
jgi:hypothetical protein